MKRYIDHRSKKAESCVEIQDQVFTSKNPIYNLPKVPKPEYKVNVKFHSVIPTEIMKVIGMNDKEYNDFLMILSLYDDYNNKMKWSKLKLVYIHFYYCSFIYRYFKIELIYQ